MKKIDFHIHTKQTFQDNNGFIFSRQTLKKYVEDRKIDCIAITNHNIFDLIQFNEIRDYLSNICVVLPGIEINVGQNAGHLLCVSSFENLLDFEAKCKKVSAKINSAQDSLNYDELVSIFDDLSKYLWIPHSAKKPRVDMSFLKKMGRNIYCGEVQNVKDFKYYLKDESKPTPLLFSDFRPHEEVKAFPSRQTYIDVNDINISSLQYVLRDKAKVALSKNEGNEKFEVISNLEISTGLNVVLGSRSSGKTYTLDEIYNANDNVKYIEQFSLLEKDPKKADQLFESTLSDEKSNFQKEYLSEFADVLDSIKSIDLEQNERKLEEYLDSLMKCAFENERQDVFSKCALWSEEPFYINNLDNLRKLIGSVMNLLEAKDYRDIIDRHLSKNALIELLSELIFAIRKEQELIKKKTVVNELIQDIKKQLNLSTAATNIVDFDIAKYILDNKKVSIFQNIALSLQKPKTLNESSYNRFKTIISSGPLEQAKDLKDIYKKNLKYADAIKSYRHPYTYLKQLKELDIPSADYYLAFAKISISIKNEYDADLSGGERAEYKLLHEIDSANNYDMLLIDEPESSFDNIFLLKDVNSLIKKLADKMPVIVVTHNSTVGMSIHPDYLIYTKRAIVNGSPIYKRFCGAPSDKELVDISGDTVSTYELTIDSLEAGKEAYLERAESYEKIRN